MSVRVGAHPFGDQLRRPLLVGGQVHGQLAEQVGRDQQGLPPLFGVRHAERTGAGDDRVDQCHVGRFVGGPLFQQADDRGAAVADGRQQQLLLGRHVPKEGARRNTCGRGDFLGGHGVVAAFDEQPKRRPTNVGPDLCALPIAQ